MTASADLYRQLSLALAGEGGVLAGWVRLGEPSLGEVFLHAGCDTAVFDMQHGTFTFDACVDAIALAALAGKPAIVRIPVGGFPTVSRLFDAGAAAVIAPMINTAADARSFAAAAKFPPVGERSYGPHRALTLSGRDPAAYVAVANALHLTFAMIETSEALDNIDAILGEAGIDGIFVGPFDLSVALSQGRTLDPGSPAVMDALDRVAERAKAAGKHAGVFCSSGAEARAMQERGFAFCSIGTDMVLLRAAAQRELAAARAPASASAG